MSDVREQLLEHQIRLRHYAEGSVHKTTCPRCSLTRKNKTDPCLSVTLDNDGTRGAVWSCHHCGWDGNVAGIRGDVNYRVKKPSTPVAIMHKPSPRGDAVDGWFAKRGITSEVLDRNQVGYEQQWMPGCEEGKTVGVITFPYLSAGEVVNVKYRAGNKTFRQVKNGTKTYYGIDDISGDTVIVVEGEIDKLSLEVAGFRSVVSVPDGAPKTVKDETPDPENDTKFSYVWDTRESFENIKRIILACDDDEPGRALVEELSRRYGKERCYRVEWPKSNDVACKDANEVLVQHGAKVLAECIQYATPYPIKGLHSASEFAAETMRLLMGETKKAYSTGWLDVDKNFKIRAGELTVITGWPGSGKSTFIDALMVNLVNAHGWKFGLCSFETPPDRHIANFIEQRVGKPFEPLNQTNLHPDACVSRQEALGAMEWIKQHIFFIHDEEASPTLSWVLTMCKALVMRHGVKGIVIDPYNQMSHKREVGMTETEYVLELLNALKRFSRAHDVHVWLVAHPSKPQRNKDGKYSAVSLYDISGSAHFYNVADIGIVVSRDISQNETTISTKKVRFKEVGTPGEVRLLFDRNTSRFAEYRPGSMSRQWERAD